MSKIAALRAKLQASANRSSSVEIDHDLYHGGMNAYPLKFISAAGFVRGDDPIAYPHLMIEPTDYLIERQSPEGYPFGKYIEDDDFIIMLFMSEDGELETIFSQADFYELEVMEDATNLLIRFKTKKARDSFQALAGNLSHAYALGVHAWETLLDEHERFAASWTVEGDTVIFEDTTDETVFNILCPGVKTRVKQCSHEIAK